MAFDFKQEYRALYQPKAAPGIVEVPPMSYIAVRGEGDPNAEGGDYQRAIGLLYGLAFTLKMGGKRDHPMAGYFDYVVPPLEGFWRQEGAEGIDYARKEAFRWISVIRLPDFITPSDFRWAVNEAARKKGEDFSRAEYMTLAEGLCVQCMHLGPYDDEPATVARMHAFLEGQGLVPDLSDARLHHEIYLSDPRRTPPQKRRTVIRHPVRAAGTVR